MNDEQLTGAITKICLDCTRAFDITAPEQRFYENRSLSLPARCKWCREARRVARAAQQE